jgi:hypothetical protein
MVGETDLARMLAGMNPTMDDAVYVFATVTEPIDETALQPRMQFHEAEGTTLIVTQAAAMTHELPCEFPSRMITLNVHSSLAGVGFLSLVTTRLAALGMGVNPVAGFYHDHLFIPQDRADEALAALHALSSEYAE